MANASVSAKQNDFRLLNIMPRLRIYRLFFSHAWNYTDEYVRMINLLNCVPLFRYHNYSVPRANPLDVENTTRLREALKRQIRPVHAVIILGGMYVTYSDWIHFEIESALMAGKPIIGVYPHGAQRMPRVISETADIRVRWNSRSVVNAVRQYSL